MVKTLEQLHKCLYGQEFHLGTYNSAVTCLLSLRNLKGQTTRWVQHLQEYNFTSEHHQGLKHTNANPLSRRPFPDECFHCWKIEQRTDGPRVRITATANKWDRQALRREQLADDDVGPPLRGRRLDNAPSGEISMTGAPSTRAIGPSGNPSQWEMACWKVTRSRQTEIRWPR